MPAKVRYYTFLEKLETRSHKGNENKFEHKILAPDRAYFSQLWRHQAAFLVERGLKIFTLPMERRRSHYCKLSHRITKFGTF